MADLRRQLCAALGVLDRRLRDHARQSHQNQGLAKAPGQALRHGIERGVTAQVPGRHHRQAAGEFCCRARGPVAKLGCVASLGQRDDGLRHALKVLVVLVQASTKPTGAHTHNGVKLCVVDRGVALEHRHRNAGLAQRTIIPGSLALDQIAQQPAVAGGTPERCVLKQTVKLLADLADGGLRGGHGSNHSALYAAPVGVGRRARVEGRIGRWYLAAIAMDPDHRR